MDVCTDYLSDASRQEIPDDNSAIITADSQQCAPPVKGARQGHADTIQSAIGFLQIKTNTRTWTIIARYPNYFYKGSLSSMTCLLN